MRVVGQTGQDDTLGSRLAEAAVGHVRQQERRWVCLPPIRSSVFPLSLSLSLSLSFSLSVSRARSLSLALSLALSLSLSVALSLSPSLSLSLYWV